VRRAAAAVALACALGALILTLLPVAALWTGWRKRPLRAGERMVAASLLVYLAYVAWVGGDHMQWFRFLVPALPLAFLLSIRRLEEASRARGRKGRLGLMLVLSVAAANLVSTSWLAVRQGWLWRDPAARSGALLSLSSPGGRGES